MDSCVCFGNCGTSERPEKTKSPEVSSSSAIFRCNKGLVSLLETNIVDHTRKLDCPFGMVSFQMLWFGSGKELQYVSASLIQWRGVVGEGASITLKI